MNEQEQFLNDLEKGDENNILEQPLTPDAEAPTGDDAAKGDEDKDSDDEPKPRNRRERRLMEKLAAERESAMFLAGKLEARTEATHALNEESDYLKSVERIYGTDTPEAQLATDLLKKALVGMRDDAKQSALEVIREEQRRASQEVAQATDELDTMVDDIEDTYGVQLTDAQEKSFFQLLEKMSPKDKDGNVIDYADHHAVWEVFADRLQKRGTDTRAKDLSSRSMVQSGASKESNLQDDAHARFLRENGII